MSPSHGQHEIETLERVFRALSHSARRRILVVLSARGGRLTAGEIASRFPCAWPTTSRHLRVLGEAGLVRVERRGRGRVYALEDQWIRRVVGAWLCWFDRGGAPPAVVDHRHRALTK